MPPKMHSLGGTCCDLCAVDRATEVVPAAASMSQEVKAILGDSFVKADGTKVSGDDALPDGIVIAIYCTRST